MLRAALLPSVLTGAFCAVFASVVNLVTDALSLGAVIILAFVSGFLGSFLARLVLK